MKKPKVLNSLICKDINIQARTKDIITELPDKNLPQEQPKETAALDKRSELA